LELVKARDTRSGEIGEGRRGFSSSRVCDLPGVHFIPLSSAVLARATQESTRATLGVRCDREAAADDEDE
jgi:hypothetical protein